MKPKCPGSLVWPRISDCRSEDPGSNPGPGVGRVGGNAHHPNLKYFFRIIHEV